MEDVSRKNPKVNPKTFEFDQINEMKVSVGMNDAVMYNHPEKVMDFLEHANIYSKYYVVSVCLNTKSRRVRLGEFVYEDMMRALHGADNIADIARILMES